MITLVCALLLAPSPAPRAAPPAAPRSTGVTVRGQLRSAGLRTPIVGARIHVTPRRGGDWSRTATTAEDGSYVLTDLPTRDLILTVVADGHERLVQPAGAAYWSARRPPVLYLQSSGAGRYRTVVATGRESHPSPSTTRLSPREIAGLPGSQGDPLRALQNLPGNARIPGGLGLLVLRGATPNQSQVFYGEHPIPRAFHFPGLASVVPGVALAGISYTPGNFASSYGNAVGGIVNMTPRSGRRDGLHGMAKFDLTSAGAAVEGRLGRGSFLVAGQRGYLDLVLAPFSRSAGGIPLPSSYDYQVILEHPLGPGATATVRLLGASDTLRYPKRGGDQSFAVVSSFHRVDLSLRKRLPGWEFLLAPAVRFDAARFADAYTDLDIHKNDTVGLLRAEMTARPAQRLRITVGADTQIDGYRATRRLDFNEVLELDRSRGLLTRSGLYLSSEISTRRLLIAPGVRINAFTGGGGQAYSVDPRLTLRWTPHRRIALSAGAGQYSQASQSMLAAGRANLVYEGPEGVPLLYSGSGVGFGVLPNAVSYLDAPLGFAPTGPVGVSQAAQVSGGVHVDILASLGLDATVFYRRVRDGLPPVRPEEPGAPAPDTGSITYGVEALLRKQLTGRLQGWIAYTWMRSEQGDLVGESLTRRRVADFDQRHNLVFVLSLALPRNWQLGARFRVVTGLPYTPILLGYVNGDDPAHGFENGNYYLPGPINTARVGTFHQLDLRVDRTWILKRCIVHAYLDVQNVYNRQNPEGVVYNAHYSGKQATVGLPILPVFGVRVEY